MTADLPVYAIQHRIPHRIRIRFHNRLSAEQLRSVVWLLEHQCPEARVRLSAGGRGLVICANDPTSPLPALEERLDQVLREPTAPLPEPPPIALVRLLRQSHQGSLKLLIALAIAGWALPVLPGTPFFVLAWWLGWRPEPKPKATTQEP